MDIQKLQQRIISLQGGPDPEPEKDGEEKEEKPSVPGDDNITVPQID